MKTRPVGTELFYVAEQTEADRGRQADRQTD